MSSFKKYSEIVLESQSKVSKANQRKVSKCSLAWVAREWWNIFEVTNLFKGGLSSRMTWQFLNALKLFSPEKIKLSNFRGFFNLHFQQKELQSCQFATYRWKAPFEFLTSQTGGMTFTTLNDIIRWLCISLNH